MSTRLAAAEAAFRLHAPTAILIDERTVSQAEYTCQLLLAAAPQAIAVGAQSNATTGDLIHVHLPGEVTACLSGQAYTFPDETPIHGCGISPDIEARPSIEGLRAGRDEVLEVAIDRLRKRLLI
jgi:C-terminal processing protease CtpA/Prc